MRYPYFIDDNLYDPVLRGVMRNRCFLRSYQAEVLRTVFDSTEQRDGKRFTVTFPRQSGKNETQAQLESAVMAANLYRGGSIIKILPTDKNQGEISRNRLERVLRGNGQQHSKAISCRKDRTRYGSTALRCGSCRKR